MSAFTPAGSGGLPPPQITITGATNRSEAQISMPVAGTEYSYLLPIGTTQYLLKTVSAAAFSVTFVSGQPGTTIPRGCFIAEGGLSLASATAIYFKSTVAGQTAEIVVWT